jgi:hypothetical protein
VGQLRFGRLPDEFEADLHPLDMEMTWGLFLFKNPYVSGLAEKDNGRGVRVDLVTACQ